ncbi:MAG: hypothetical protein ACYCUD_10310 [Candidatus Dormibacteria bacterium]
MYAIPMVAAQGALPSPGEQRRATSGPAAPRRFRPGRVLVEAAVIGAAIALGLAGLTPGAAPGPLTGRSSAFGPGKYSKNVAQGSNQATAKVAAQRLLTLLPLPPGSVRRPGPAAPILQGAAPGSPDSQNLVARTEFWQVPESVGTFIRWVQRERSSRLTQFEAGTLHGSRGIEYFRTWELSTRPPGLVSALLVYAFAELGPASTAVRIDAQVIWRPARPASSLIPHSDRYAELGWERYGPKFERGVVPLSNPKLLLGLITAINRLPAVPGGVASCPAALLTTSLRFATRRGGPANALLSYTGCDQFTLTTPGGTVLLGVGPVLGWETRVIGPAAQR